MTRPLAERVGGYRSPMKKARVLLTPELRAEIARLLEGGMKRQNIAAQLGISVSSVDDVISRRRQANRNQASPDDEGPIWSAARILMAARLLRAGQGAATVAQRLTDDLPGVPVAAINVEMQFAGRGYVQFRRHAG